MPEPRNIMILSFAVWTGNTMQEKLKELVNEGWVIVAAGGSSADGFVILQHG